MCGEAGIDIPTNRKLLYSYMFTSVSPPCEPIVNLIRSTETRLSGQTGISESRHITH